MPGGAGLARASAHKGFFGQLSAVGYTTLGRASVGLRAAGPGAAFPAGGKNPNQMLKCSPSAVRRGAATLRPAPPQGHKPGPVAPGSFSARGWGRERGCWRHHGGMVEPAPSSAPCLAPYFFWDGALGGLRALGRCWGTPGWGEVARMGSIVEVTGQLGHGEIRPGTTKKSLQSLIPLEGGGRLICKARQQILPVWRAGFGDADPVISGRQVAVSDTALGEGISISKAGSQQLLGCPTEVVPPPPAPCGQRELAPAPCVPPRNGCTMGLEPLTRMKQGRNRDVSKLSARKGSAQPVQAAGLPGKGPHPAPSSKPNPANSAAPLRLQALACDSHPESIFRQKTRQAGELCLPAFGPGSPD